MEHDFTQPVADIATVPAQFQPLYEETEVEGKKSFNLKRDDITKGAVEAIVGLNTALKASRAEFKANKGKAVDLSPLAEYGEDPATILAAFTKTKEELTAKGSDDVKRQIDKIKSDLASGHATELTAAQKRNEALTSQLYGHLVESEAITAIAGAKGVPELLLPFVKQQVKVNEADGKLQVMVVDAAGDPRYSGTSGLPMTIKELVAEMKANTQYGRLFDSEAPAGGGTPPGGPGNPGKPGMKTENMTPVDKISAGLAKGQHLSGRRAANAKP